MSDTRERNRLAHETSPYLQQHADNPVDWFPWGEEALAKARAEDKPILLSIGYSACHWCHVMAHESFEDEETAEVMNHNFVNIKVDREERPDLDKIYQTAHYMLTQRNGGWPLTVFLTPEDRVPFFAGTYFPREPRYGMPSFKDLLRRIATLYEERRAEIDKQNQQLVNALGEIYGPQSSDARLDSTMLDTARSEMGRSFDARNGGFGSAPKFPHPSDLERLLRHWATTTQSGNADTAALDMVTATLMAMARGGIFDQLGGGFARYSVDEQWMIPHFEKMLYDNGPLLALYAQAYAATGSEVYERVARETADWALREMRSPEGGFYSSMDADSEGEEGRFYVWDRDHVRALLSDEEYAVFAPRFGLDQAANFEGRWHLYVRQDLASLAEATGRTEAQVRELIDSARAKLLAARNERVWPGRDEKVLTSWNALMIKGLAVAARHLGVEAYEQAATRAVDFLYDHLRRDGRLLASYKDGHAQLNAYLDDYAFLLDALLELLQVRWRREDLAWAQELAEVLMQHFWDHEAGGFFFTADDHEDLVQRPKAMADESTPSGNGVAAIALQRLGHLLGETRYLDAAEQTLRAAAWFLEHAPAAHASLLHALEEQLHPPQILILRGEPSALQGWHAACLRPYAPRRLAFAIPPDAAGLPEALAEKAPRGEAVAYSCLGTTCSAPITERAELTDALAETATLNARTS